MSTQPRSHYAEIAGHPHSGRPGYRPILLRADPDTSWERVAKWCNRARAEGVV